MAKQSNRRQERLEETAFHEAGHAAIAILYGRKFLHVSIVENEESSGRLLLGRYPKSFRPDIDRNRKTRSYVEREILVALGGAVAAKRIRGRFNHQSAMSDYEYASDMATHICGNEKEAGKFLDWLGARAEAELELDHNWRGVKALAAALLKDQVISAAKARKIFNSARLNRPQKSRL